MTPETALARFAQAPVTDLAALTMMRLSLLDWAACGLAGVDEPVSQILRRKAREEGGREKATLLGGGRAPARVAALLNGTTSHALDYDDTHFAHIGHPSVAVIPAALAMAERQGASFGAFLAAALVGVEASVAVGLWLGRDHYEVGFHQTATAGAFGATLAAARLAGLTEAQTLAALGLCATRASGLKSQFGTMGKPYNAGLAAETGVEAVMLAQLGMTSSGVGLSHPQGFGPTHHGQNEADAFATLGTIWRFETVSHKFHACCHGLHAMLEAMATLDIPPEDVAEVTIRTHPRWLTVCNKPAPATGLEAKFSYRFTCAMALAGVDTAAIASYSDDLTRRPDLIALSALVKVIADPRLTEMQAQVRLTTRDGGERVASHDLDAPIDPSVRAARLRRKARSLIGEGRATALERAIDTADMGALVAALG